MVDHDDALDEAALALFKALPGKGAYLLLHEVDLREAAEKVVEAYLTARGWRTH